MYKPTMTLFIIGGAKIQIIGLKIEIMYTSLPPLYNVNVKYTKKHVSDKIAAICIMLPKNLNRKLANSIMFLFSKPANPA